MLSIIDPSVRKGAVASSVLAVVLVLSARIQNGANAAGHAATDLVMPVGLIWLFLFAAAVTFFYKGSRSASAFFFSVWIAMTLSFNLLLASAIFESVERSPLTTLAEEDLPLRAVIVLGGGATTNVHGVDEINGDGERVFSAAQMWHAGETKVIICTGEPGNTTMPATGEAGRRLLVSVGVPDEAILVVGGEDTEGEMQCLKELMDDPPDVLGTSGKLGLITSAFHMNRALRKAGQVSLEMIPISVAYRNFQGQTLSIQSLIPSAAAGELFRIAMKEHLAGLLGK